MRSESGAGVNPPAGIGSYHKNPSAKPPQKFKIIGEAVGKNIDYSGPFFQDSKLRWYPAEKGAGNDRSKAKEFYG